MVDCTPAPRLSAEILIGVAAVAVMRTLRRTKQA
jgi:hypothetical protein